MAGQACGTETGPGFSKLAPIPPCPGLVAAAQARQIPLEKIDPQGEPGSLNPGDSFTGLVTLREKGSGQTQWLVYLTALPASPKELSKKTPQPMVLYSGRNNKLIYASSPALVRLRTVGPFIDGRPNESAKSEDHSVCFALDKGLLGLGLDLAASTICRAEQTKAKDGFFWFGSSAPKAAEVVKARETAAALHLTTDEERALGGMFPALFSYAQVIEHTQGLQELMMKVIAKPSIWSVVGHLGVTAVLTVDSRHVGAMDLSQWGWPGSPSAYRLPMLFELNNKPALRVTLVVTDPRPPLLTCGGIIGMLAEKPDDKETYLTLQIIGARHEEGP